MYPAETLQGLSNTSSWWEKDEGKTYCRGRLCFAFVPFVVQTPLTLIPTRTSATEHHEVDASIEQMRIGEKKRLQALPVAALPLASAKEMYTVYKAKVRPCLIIGDGCANFPPEICKNRPKWQIAHTVIVAPYFGIEQDGTRGGFPPLFVDRVKRCEFPQFFWDKLPHNNKEGFLNFMHAQPIGKHHDSIDRTEYKLSEKALVVIDEWLLWSFSRTMNPDGFLHAAREILLS